MIGSTDATEYQCRDGSYPESRQLPRKNVAAVVGGSYSSVTVQVSISSKVFNLILKNFHFSNIVSLRRMLSNIRVLFLLCATFPVC